jgi:hypothetical protein
MVFDFNTGFRVDTFGTKGRCLMWLNFSTMNIYVLYLVLVGKVWYFSVSDKTYSMLYKLPFNLFGSEVI